MPPPRRRGGGAGGDRGPRAAGGERHAGGRSLPRRGVGVPQPAKTSGVGAPQPAKAAGGSVGRGPRGRRERHAGNRSAPRRRGGQEAIAARMRRGGATRRWPQPTKTGVGAPQEAIAARVRRGRGDTQTTARATRRRLQPAKVAEGTSRRGPHGSGRKQHTGDRRRGGCHGVSALRPAQVQIDAACTGAKNAPWRTQEGDAPLAGRHSTPPRRAAPP